MSLKKAVFDLQSIFAEGQENIEYLIRRLWETRVLFSVMDTPLPLLNDVLKKDPNVSSEQRTFRSSIPEVENSEADSIENLPDKLNISQYRSFTLDQARSNIDRIRQHLEANVIEQLKLMGLSSLSSRCETISMKERTRSFYDHWVAGGVKTPLLKSMP
ncbi:MAG: hypothetical protein R2827_15365 [Bdellovibrionales bacterium]